jgi:hypothetical protein
MPHQYRPNKHSGAIPDRMRSCPAYSRICWTYGRRRLHTRSKLGLDRSETGIGEATEARPPLVRKPYGVAVVADFVSPGAPEALAGRDMDSVRLGALQV